MLHHSTLLAIKKKVETINDAYDNGQIGASVALAQYLPHIKGTFPVLLNYLKGKAWQYDPQVKELAARIYVGMFRFIPNFIEDLKFAADRVSANTLLAKEISGLVEFGTELLSFASTEDFQLSSDTVKREMERILHEICMVLYWHTDYFRRAWPEIQDSKEGDLIYDWGIIVLNAMDAFLPHLMQALVSKKCFDKHNLSMPITLFKEIVHLLMQFSPQETVISQLKDFLNQQKSAEDNIALFKWESFGRPPLNDFYYMLSCTTLVDMPLWAQGESEPIVDPVNVRDKYMQALYFAIMSHNSSLDVSNDSRRYTYVVERLKPFLPAGMDVSGLTIAQLKGLPAFKALLPELILIAREWNLPKIVSPNKPLMIFAEELLNKEAYDYNKRCHEAAERAKVSLQAQKQMGIAYGMSKPSSVGPDPFVKVQKSLSLACG